MSDQKKCFILTRQISEYNQDGEYFVAAFQTIPTAEQLNDALSLTSASGSFKERLALVLHLSVRGGGRISDEYEWYNLREETLR